MKYTEDTLYDRLVGQYGFDPGDLDDFFSVNSKRNWLTYINKGETDIDRLADVIEDWLGYINPMDESTAKDFYETEVIEQQDYINDLCNEYGFNVIFDEDTLGGVLVDKDGKEIDVQFEIDGDIVTVNGKEFYEFIDSLDHMDESTAKHILKSAGYLIENNLVELSDNDIEEAKELLMDEYGYPYESVEAAFEYQDTWISDVKMGSTPSEIAAVVSDFLDSLSDEELEEIGAL